MASTSFSLNSLRPLEDDASLLLAYKYEVSDMFSETVSEFSPSYVKYVKFKTDM